MTRHAPNPIHLALAVAIPLVLAQPASAQLRDSSAQAKEYTQLAERYRPSSRSEQQLVAEFMSLPASQRNAFKSSHPDADASIWDYGAYAACFYGSVAGGADVVEAGDECKAEWID